MTFIYEGWLKTLSTDQFTLIMEYDQIGLFFNMVSLWFTYFFRQYCSAWIPFVKKVINNIYELFSLWTFCPTLVCKSH